MISCLICCIAVFLSVLFALPMVIAVLIFMGLVVTVMLIIDFICWIIDKITDYYNK